MYFLVMLELPLVHTAASWKLSLSLSSSALTLHLYSAPFFFFLFLHAAVNESLTTKETSRSGKVQGCLDAGLKETSLDQGKFLTDSDLRLGQQVAVLRTKTVSTTRTAQRSAVCFAATSA